MQISFAARPSALQSRDSPHPKRRLRVRLVPRQQSSDVAGLFLRLRHGLGRFVGVICRQNELRSGSGWVRWRLSGRTPPGLITNSILLCGLFLQSKPRFQQTDNQGLHQLFLMVSWNPYIYRFTVPKICVQHSFSTTIKTHGGAAIVQGNFANRRAVF